MPRQILLLAKIVPGVDEQLDVITAGLSSSLDLRALVDPQLSGRGLIHWSCWYDPWLMFNDLCPDYWSLKIGADEVLDSLWKLDLASDWSAVERAIGADRQWQEQTWLPWQLWQAYTAFQDWNDRAVLYYGRAIIGGSLGDDDLLGGG